MAEEEYFETALVQVSSISFKSPEAVKGINKKGVYGEFPVLLKKEKSNDSLAAMNVLFPHHTG